MRVCERERDDMHLYDFKRVNCIIGAGFSFVSGEGVGWEEGREWGHEFLQTEGNRHQRHSYPLCLLYSLPTSLSEKRVCVCCYACVQF